MNLTPLWCIGLPRTGTTSLTQALTLLGYRAKHNPTFAELRELNAAADNSCAMHYRYLDERFPESKFVLNTRDLEPWLESMRVVFDPELRSHPPRDDPDFIIARRMAVCGTVRYDRAALVEAYFRHQHDVLCWFKGRRDKLLVMNVAAGEGWPELCGFLGLPVPHVPFPHLNQGPARS